MWQQPATHHRKGRRTRRRGDLDAVFEVFPEVKIGDLAGAEIEKLSASVDDSAIDKTVDILRKQRRSFAQRAMDAAAQDGDRVTVDFEGKLDGEPFQGSKAEDFQFPGRRRPDAQGVRRRCARHEAGREQDLPLAFPRNTTARMGKARRRTSWSPSRKSKRPTCLEVERCAGQVAGHCRWHRGRSARRHQDQPGAQKSSSVCWRATSRP